MSLNTTITSHRPMQCPPRSPHFTGRESEISQLLESLRKEKITGLVGPGGIGKSAIAGEVVWRIVSSDSKNAFNDGIIWHSFYSEPKVDLALRHIARSLGREPETNSFLAAQQATRGKNLLIVLDGAEVADNLSRVYEVLDHCVILITTRNPLDVPARPIHIQPLDRTAAISLFHKFADQPYDLEQVEKICELVGGLPLAIQLAGRYLAQNEASIDDYVAWLQEAMFTALDQGKRSSQSVYLLIERTTQKLNEEQRLVLSTIGLLAMTSFDRAVVDNTMDCSSEVVTTSLQRLIANGLLIQVKARYLVNHLLIYNFIKDHMLPSVPLDNLLYRVAHHFAVRANQESESGPEGYQRLNADRSHIMVVLQHLRHHQRWADALELSWQIDQYLDVQGHSAERLEALEIGLEAVRQLAIPDNELILLNNQGMALMALRRPLDAVSSYQKALELSRCLNDPGAETNHLANLGLAYEQLDKLDLAMAHIKEALDIARINQDRRAQGRCLGYLAQIYLKSSQVEAAIEHYNEALAIVRQEQESRLEGIFEGNLGRTYLQINDIPNALLNLSRALTISRDLGDRVSERAHLVNLANAYHACGNLQQATNCYEGAVEISRAIQNPLAELADWKQLGMVYKGADQLDNAGECFKKAATLAESDGQISELELILNELAITYRLQMNNEAALEIFQKVHELSCKLKNRVAEAEVLANLGTTYAALQNYEQSRTFLRESKKLYTELGLPERNLVQKLLDNLQEQEKRNTSMIRRIVKILRRLFHWRQ